MARTKSWPAVLSVLVFFLAGAAGAILWDLRGHALPQESASPGPAPARKASKAAPRKQQQRAAAPSGSAPRLEARRSDSGRTAPRPRKTDARFEKVGIPMESRAEASQRPAAALSEAQAARILKALIESRGYYGLSADCLWEKPLGFRGASYEFEIVAADCASIVRGGVIGRWVVDANTGEASYRTPEGTYQSAP